MVYSYTLSFCTWMQALLGLPDVEALEKMVKACKDAPLKIQDHELTVAPAAKPVDLSNVVRKHLQSCEVRFRGLRNETDSL